MSVLMALTIGLIVFVAVLQVLQRDIVRMVVGLYLFWNAANLLIIAVAKVQAVRAPIVVQGTGPMADPLVQAMVLTAIVISFGFTAFLVTLTFWMAFVRKSIDINEFTDGRG